MNSQQSNDEFDQQIRRQIYDHFMRKGVAPTSKQIAEALSSTADDVKGAFERLAAGRVVVLQDANGEILMANPFSAVPTPFLVETDDGSYWGNCIWDALGIPAMLGKDARISTGCGDCNDAMELVIKGGELQDPVGIVHFSVPAAHWWDNIKFT